jgi:hypothetical protein
MRQPNDRCRGNIHREERPGETSHKSKHLAANPHASLAYIRGDVQKPVYLVAEWEDDRDEKRRIWDRNPL